MTNLPAYEKIPVGISACLMGQEVRYNGGHKQSKYCLKTLQSYFSFRPFCPEVAIGMGVPREPIRLVEGQGDVENARAVGVKDSDLDVTDSLYEYGEQIGKQHQDLSGYIFMQDSPSCGLFRVKVYRENGYPSDNKRSGIYAQALMKVNPLIPVEEEGRLHDPVLRENFLLRVFIYHEWRQTVATDLTPRALVEFHSRHKYTLMAHSQSAYKALGQLVATVGAADCQKVAGDYILQLMDALKKPAKRRAHSNVLQHILGYLKRNVESPLRQDLLSEIERYRRGQVHLSVPMTLLNHYIRHHGNEYIKSQSYLEPYPTELGLRNYI